MFAESDFGAPKSKVFTNSFLCHTRSRPQNAISAAPMPTRPADKELIVIYVVEIQMLARLHAASAIGPNSFSQCNSRGRLNVRNSSTVSEGSGRIV